MSTAHDQQPIQRTVGSRRERDGRPLTPTDRAAMTAHARYRTRAPKGVFIYSSSCANGGGPIALDRRCHPAQR